MNDDPAIASQATFRAVMDAFARPGEIHAVSGTDVPVPLWPSTAAVLKTLADHETPVWFDIPLSRDAQVGQWLKFHTGATPVVDPGAAAFAVIGDPVAMPPFSTFSPGTPDYPDRGATIIVQVAQFEGDPIVISGPGIRQSASFSASPLPQDFSRRLIRNRESFPRGIDVLLAAPNRILALPRSISIVEPT